MLKIKVLVKRVNRITYLSILGLLFTNVLFSQDLTNKKVTFYYILSTTENIRVNKINFHKYSDVSIKIKNLSYFYFDSLLYKFNDLKNEPTTNDKLVSLFAKIIIHGTFYNKKIYLWNGDIIQYKGKKYKCKKEFKKLIFSLVDYGINRKSVDLPLFLR
jgi:hypothetical protein